MLNSKPTTISQFAFRLFECGQISSNQYDILVNLEQKMRAEYEEDFMKQEPIADWFTSVLFNEDDDLLKF
jgi:hypothetical protein